MHPNGRRTRLILFLCLLAVASESAQQLDSAGLVTTGQITLGGRQVPYRIRRLPVSSFPDLPPAIAAQLMQRDCLIPQTYEAHRPENVVHASFERPGSTDWAVLCSARGEVSLLVSFASAPDRLMTLASAPETHRLQSRATGDELGFNWGIDPASPQTVHEAQIGVSPRPARLDHDALADSVIDHKTIYRFFTKGAWTLLELPD